MSHYGARDDRGQCGGKGIKFFSVGALLLAVVTVGAKNGQLPNERQLSGDQLQERPVQRIKCNRPMSTVQHLSALSFSPLVLLSGRSPLSTFSFSFSLSSTSAPLRSSVAAIHPLRRLRWKTVAETWYEPAQHDRK